MFEDSKVHFKSELEEERASHREMISKYEKDAAALEGQAETLKQELSKEKQLHSQTWMILKNLKAENEALRQEMAQKITSLQETYEETETRLQGELQEAKFSHREITSKYETEIFMLKVEVDSLKQELNTNIESDSKKAIKEFNVPNERNGSENHMDATNI
ncbi:hypothetical protein XENOCAPTIV_015597 [Xenoophorus captivus]|uniref:Uncharacterized protein n=1 Tax=Xenoophorus captivus TaxID=1517983 RepID=A0ABV0SGB3_9TELE